MPSEMIWARRPPRCNRPIRGLSLLRRRCGVLCRPGRAAPRDLTLTTVGTDGVSIPNGELGNCEYITFSLVKTLAPLLAQIIKMGGRCSGADGTEFAAKAYALDKFRSRG